MPRYTEASMPRRVHLALALILLLVVAPLASATCGIGCMAAIPHHAAPLATSQSHCVVAATCCHSSSAAICTAGQAPDAIAALLPIGTSVSSEAPAIAVLSTKGLLQDPSTPLTGIIDSSPPGQSLASSPIPLRI